MKTKYLVLSLILSYSFLFSTGQNNLKDLFNNTYNIGDTITLKLDNLGGTIQWEESVDIVVWTNISGQTLDSLIYIVDSEKYIRASVTHGSCNPYYSDTLHITLQSSSPCPTTVTDYDGNNYNTALIGTQCWMAENLATTHYASGTAIPNVLSNNSWSNLVDYNSDDAYCYYDNSSSNANIYGALYTWAATMGDNAVSSNSNPSGVQGACPTGWHLPSDNEWKQLEMQLGMSQSESDTTGWRGTDQGSQLAGDSSLWYSGNLVNNINFGTSGFTALPGGYRSSNNGSFFSLGNHGIWWSSTESNSSSAWIRLLNYNLSEVYRDYGYKSIGYSIRCTKD